MRGNLSNRVLISLWVLTAAMALMTDSCYYDIEEELYPLSGICDTTAVSFSLDVMPVIQSNCVNCHSGGSPSGSISLTNHDQISQQTLNGSLVCSISHGSGCSAMPQNAGQLPSCDIEKIIRWRDAGALDN